MNKTLVRLTDEEKEFIENNYKIMSGRQISAKLNRPKTTVSYYISKVLNYTKIKFIDIKIGDVFNRLTVIGEIFLNKRNRMVCKCECGKIHNVLKVHLIKNVVKSCGCLLYENNKDKILFKDFGFINGSWYNRLKLEARKRKLEFNVTQEYLNGIFINQNEKCAISRLPIKITSERHSIGSNASLDRIDNSKGYIEGNVQFLHKHVNYMKWTHQQDYFIALCRIITETQDEIIYANSITNDS